MRASIRRIAILFYFLVWDFQPFTVIGALHPPFTVAALDVLHGCAILYIAAGHPWIVRAHPTLIELVMQSGMFWRVAMILRRCGLRQG